MFAADEMNEGREAADAADDDDDEEEDEEVVSGSMNDKDVNDPGMSAAGKTVKDDDLSLIHI